MSQETEFQPYREGLDELAEHYKQVLTLLGEDTEREGLLKTPMRVAKAMQVLTRGYQMDAHKVLTDALFKEDYSQMVIVKDIDFFSLCEHHMLPFYGKADAQASWRDGGRRGQAHVHADEGHREAELHYHHQRLQWCFQPGQDPPGIHELNPQQSNLIYYVSARQRL